MAYFIRSRLPGERPRLSSVGKRGSSSLWERQRMILVNLWRLWTASLTNPLSSTEFSSTDLILKSRLPYQKSKNVCAKSIKATHCDLCFHSYALSIDKAKLCFIFYQTDIRGVLIILSTCTSKMSNSCLADHWQPLSLSMNESVRFHRPVE